MVEPHGEKMNVSRVMQDIPTIIDSPAVRVFTADSKRAWQVFLEEELPALLEKPETPDRWPIHQLLAKKVHIQPPGAREQLSDTLLNLHRRVLHANDTAEVILLIL